MQEYFVYFKFFAQNYVAKYPLSAANVFIQRFLYTQKERPRVGRSFCSGKGYRDKVLEEH